MAKGVQSKPRFVPVQKIKRVRLSMNISTDLLEDLKKYTLFLNQNNHDSKIDEVVEEILTSIRKDKCFKDWKKSQSESESNNREIQESVSPDI